jgi:large subunit ribosomal protein L29
MKASEIVKLSPNELEEKLTGLKKDLFFLRMQHATNQLDNPIRISQVRKDIARVKTVIRMQQIEEAGGNSDE